MVRHVGLLPYCCRKYARQSLLELLGRAQLTLITKQTGKCHACNIYAAGVDILTLIAHSGFPDCAASVQLLVGSQAGGASPVWRLHA